jgi:queuine tRNA-ribosyltransferase
MDPSTANTSSNSDHGNASLNRNGEQFRFEIVHQSRRSGARAGVLHTPHGSIETPSFVPVATNAVLKGVDPHLQNTRLDQQLMFCNTYHLMLQPGAETVRALGGLHRFMGGYHGPLITDSGGFQVYSMRQNAAPSPTELKGGRAYPSQRQKPGAAVGGGAAGGSNAHGGGGVLHLNEAGVVFRSYRDGSRQTLTPESSVALQRDLGADIVVPLDELPANHTDAAQLEVMLHRTHRWQARSLRYFLDNPPVHRHPESGASLYQAMFGIIHGGTDLRLRRLSAGYLTRLPFDGFAIGTVELTTAWAGVICACVGVFVV